MTREQAEAAVAAGWRPHPLLTKESLAVQWRYPQLRMRVWADPAGMHLLASLEQMGDDGRLNYRQIARALWQPKEVTERAVVEWGRRALVAWLEANADVP